MAKANIIIGVKEAYTGENIKKILDAVEEAGMHAFKPPLAKIGLIVGVGDQEILPLLRAIEGIQFVDTEEEFNKKLIQSEPS